MFFYFGTNTIANNQQSENHTDCKYDWKKQNNKDIMSMCINTYPYQFEPPNATYLIFDNDSDTRLNQCQMKCFDDTIGMGFVIICDFFFVVCILVVDTLWLQCSGVIFQSV